MSSVPCPRHRHATRAGTLVAALLVIAGACGSPLEFASGPRASGRAGVSDADAEAGHAHATHDERATSAGGIPAATASDFPPDALRRILRMSPLPPPPPDPTNAFADDGRAARLGQALFHDARLSSDGSTACVSCHAPDHGWSDGRRRARGVDIADVHAPTLLDVAQQRWFFWDGRADTLWTQALFPLENPKEHGADRLLVAHVLHDDEALARAYEDVFGALPGLDDTARFPARARPVEGDPSHPLDVAWRAMSADDRAAIDDVFANVGKSLAAYERLLRPGPSPLDTFVAGLRSGDPEQLAALDADAVAGLSFFVGRGQCFVCHGGPTLSDLEFHDVRLHLDTDDEALVAGRSGAFRSLRGNPFGGGGVHSDDPLTGADKIDSLLPAHELFGAFKTPSLRNVARTAPYMHRGQLRSLDDVLDHYSRMDAGSRAHRGQHAAPRQEESILMPLHLRDDERRGLLAFLRALTGGEVDAALIGVPDGFSSHPPSTRARGLDDFVALSRRSTATTSLPYRLSLDPRLDRAQLLSVADDERAADAGDPSRATLFLSGVERLTADEAAAVARFDGRRLVLPDMPGLDVDDAQRLLAFGAGRPEVELFLDGVTALTPDVAALLGAWTGARISLGALHRLDVPTARALAAFDGALVLNGLLALDPATARALASPVAPIAPGTSGTSGASGTSVASDASFASIPGGRRMLVLDGLPRLDVSLAEALGAAHGAGLSLNGVTALEPDQVQALQSARVGLLRLDSVLHITPEIVDAFTGVRARTVSLRGISMLGPDLRARLAASPAIFQVGED